MEKLQKLLLTVFLLGSIFLSGNASALTMPGPIPPGPLDIDFRLTDWLDANGEHSWTVGNVEATALWDKFLYQDTNDGLGIMGGEPDEINYREKLKINLGLGEDEGIYVSGVWITDLFAAPDGIDGEEGRVKLKVIEDGGGTSYQYFDFLGGNAHQDNGEIFVDFDTTYLVDKAYFYIIGETCDNEFSVAGFTSPVPEPATMLLLGSGLIGLIGAGRKKIFSK
jgi:hypothetical protein